MELSAYSLTLDIYDQNAAAALNLRAGETGREIRLTLSERGTPYALGSGCYAVFSGRKPDGTILWNGCRLEENTIVYGLTAQTTALAGQIPCQIRLYGPGGKLICSPDFTLIVEEPLVGDSDLTVVSANEITALTELVSEAGNAARYAGDALAAAEHAAETAARAAADGRSAVADAGTALADAGFAAARAEASIQIAEAAAAASQQAKLDAQRAAAGAEAALRNAGAATESANQTIASVDAAVEEIRAVVSDGTAAPAVICRAGGKAVALKNSARRLLQGLKLCGRTVQKGTPTPDAPAALENAAGRGSATVTVAGKNLFKPSVEGEVQNRSVRAAVTEDWNVVLNGTADGTMWLDIGQVQLAQGDVVTVSVAQGIVLHVRDMTALQTVAQLELHAPVKTFAAPSSGSYAFCLANGAGTVFQNAYVNLMVEYGPTATAYEPCREAQTLTVSTPSGLPGIPVTTGGNYTDETGQAWVCDEVDFARGVYVQRIGVKKAQKAIGGTLNTKGTAWLGCVADGAWIPASNWYAGAVMCSHLPTVTNGDQYNGTRDLGISVTVDRTVYISVPGLLSLADINAWLSEQDIRVCYALAAPIETALPAEVLAQYAALHTNYPSTTLYNDAGAYMEAKYVADTKSYIDSRFSELAAALVKSL